MKREWYSEADIAGCAQHLEAKILANKYYQQWSNLIDNMPLDDLRKLTGMLTKTDKLEIELSNIIRGTMRCCTPESHGFTNPFSK